MSTPTVTFRVKPDRQNAIREVVNAIKDDPGLTAAMLEFIRTRPAPVQGRRGAGAICNVGPFRNEEAALSFLAGRLKAALHPEAIFLFGSRAAGTGRPDSGFDLLVISPSRQYGTDGLQNRWLAWME